jgi:hypothetical protein
VRECEAANSEKDVVAAGEKIECSDVVETYIFFGRSTFNPSFETETVDMIASRLA